MFDAIKNYLALANGLTEVTRQRALSAAKALVTSGEATAEQVTNLADDLLTTSRNNRDTIVALIRYEIDRALVRLGLATSEEVAALVQRIESLDALVQAFLAPPASKKAASPAAPESSSPSPEAPAGTPGRPTKRATKAARKAPAKRSPAKRAPAKRVAGGTSPGATSAEASPREAAGESDPSGESHAAGESTGWRI